MTSPSWILAACGWFAALGGVAVALLGLLLIGAMFSGRGIPVSGAGLFVILTVGAGPLLTLSGAGIIVSAFKLIGGYAWARTTLEIFSWTALCASAGWLAYSASQLRNIHSYHVVQGAMFFFATGAPAIAMIVALRSEAIRMAMTR